MAVRRAAPLLGILSLLGFLATASLTQAQLPPNTPYDGRATLARVRFNAVQQPGGRWTAL